MFSIGVISPSPFFKCSVSQILYCLQECGCKKAHLEVFGTNIHLFIHFYYYYYYNLIISDHFGAYKETRAHRSSRVSLLRSSSAAAVSLLRGEHSSPSSEARADVRCPAHAQPVRVLLLLLLPLG